MDEDAEAALSLAEYLNIDRLLNQDIEVGGVRVRTEEIIDSHQLGSDLVALSPPSSDNTSDSFEDLLGNNLANLDSVSTADSPDMTVQGVKIEPPEWWADSLTGNTITSLLQSNIPPGSLATSADDSHPWSSNKSEIDDAIAALDDMEKFFGSGFH